MTHPNSEVPDLAVADELQDGVMYASASYGGSPITDDRMEHLSRWGGATETEVRYMAADLWQRRKGEQFAKHWAEIRATPPLPASAVGEMRDHLAQAETLLIYLRGCVSRTDEDGMIDVPADYITDSIELLTALASYRSQESGEVTDMRVGVALLRWDELAGYSKVERMRAALTAAKGVGSGE